MAFSFPVNNVLCTKNYVTSFSRYRPLPQYFFYEHDCHSCWETPTKKQRGRPLEIHNERYHWRYLGRLQVLQHAMSSVHSVVSLLTLCLQVRGRLREVFDGFPFSSIWTVSQHQEYLTTGQQKLSSSQQHST